jgi:hypothetical protein
VTLTGVAEFKNYHQDSPESMILNTLAKEQIQAVTSHIKSQIIYVIYIEIWLRQPQLYPGSRVRFNFG